MRLTWFDANTWLLQWQSLSILIDPWLVGDLVFGNAPWLFRGTRSRSWPLPKAVDLILLSQGLPDHSHVPTLMQLDRAIPVVASASAAKVVKQLGFKHVTALSPNETYTQADCTITALPGAPLGPLVQENAYVVACEGRSLYYEPHGYPDPSLAQFAPLDVAITPLETLRLPLGATIIQGFATAAAIAQTTQARVMLPTAGVGSASYAGLLANVIKTEGGAAAVRLQLTAAQSQTTIFEPEPGITLERP